MLRTQVQLTSEQVRILKQLAADKGVIALAGRFRCGISDLSTNHDKYLAEVYHK